MHKSENNRIVEILLMLGFMFSIISIHTIHPDGGLTTILNQNTMKYPLFLTASLALFSLCIQPNRLLVTRKHVFVLVLFALLIVISYLNTKGGRSISDAIRLFAFLPFLFISPIKNKMLLSLLRWFMYIFPLIMLIYSVAQGVTFGDSRRFIFSSYDPNYSSFYIAIAFLLCRKLELSKLSLVYIGFGLLTMSRGFILFVLAYYFISYIKHKKIFNWILTKTNVFANFVIAQILLITGSIILLLSFDFSNDNELMDGSNYLRFTYTVQGVDYLLSDPDALWSGAGPSYWSVKKGGTGTAGTTGAVHNGILNPMIEDGIVYTMCYFVLIFMVIGRYKKNSEYIYPYIISALFLGSVYTIVFSYMWLFVLSINTREKLSIDE